MKNYLVKKGKIEYWIYGSETQIKGMLMNKIITSVDWSAKHWSEE